jgi:hypothetical protein
LQFRRSDIFGISLLLAGSAVMDAIDAIDN